MRVTDVCPRMEDALAIAALYVCSVRMLYRLRRANQSWRLYPAFLIEENRWRAQRYGVDGTLFDLGKGELVPFVDLVEELLALIAEDARALGCEAEVTRAGPIAAEGTSADRQLRKLDELIKAGASREEALAGVVDMLIAETVEGTPAGALVRASISAGLRARRFRRWTSVSGILEHVPRINRSTNSGASR